MARFIRSSRFTILAVALTLGLAVNAPTQVQAQSKPSSLGSRLENAFRPPAGTGVPRNREGGGTRQGIDEFASCIRGNESLIALVPTPRAEGEVGIGETAAEYPTVFWYMPKTAAPTVEFVLRDASKQEVYKVRYDLQKSPEGFTPSGLMSLTLPASAKLPPLQIGQVYHWELALKCDPLDSSADIVAEGGIKRVQADPNLALRIQQVSPEEQVALYADKKLWYETLTALAKLQRDRPNDNNLVEAWNKLLASVGLDSISDEPIVQGARTLTTTN